jgi:hypothetical protein
VVGPRSGDAERANRGTQLAAAFHLAYERGDATALEAILDDATGDLMPFAVALASLPLAVVRRGMAADQWRSYLRAVIDVSVLARFDIEPGEPPLG